MEVNELIKYLLMPVTQIALIIGLAEVVKKLELFDKKYIPVLDLLLGLISGIGIYTLYFNYSIVEGLVIGLALGLSACGTFSGIKNLTEKKE